MYRSPWGIARRPCPKAAQCFPWTLIGGLLSNHYRTMRLLLGVVGAAAFATGLGACAAISGLSAYSTGDCPTDGCDASVHAGTGDGTVDAGVGPGTDSPEGTSDADAGQGDDGEAASGCAPGFLTCDGGCVDPAMAATCGSCDNACGGDAALCASAEAGSYACTSSCPASSPTDCNGQCVDTSSDPANCMTCGNACTTNVSNAHATCNSGACTFACNGNYTYCGSSCVDFMTDNANCGGCGASHACAASAACVNGVCTTEQGPDAGVACPDGGCPCPDGGCPSSTATGFSCPFGSCNGNSSECTTPGGCFCSNDNQCLSTKCVKVTGENDVSCGGNCSGSGGRDGFDCELASPGIPSLATGSYACPTNSGYDNTTLSCDPTHTNCYCTADNQCPSGKCVPSTNNGNCSSCSGSGTADYRGCQAIATIIDCPIYVGCPSHTTCQYPTCYCTSDVACDSGHCIPSSHNGNCSGCTGTGTDDGHGCEPAPSSVPCMGSGGTVCTTTLTPAPVPNSGHTACLCVADSDCSSGKCVNSNSQCTGTCTGSGSADDEDCRTATSVANTWSCSLGNCDNVSSPSGTCTAAGVPCWCTSDAQCPSGAQCASWAGCASGACSGSGTGNAFHCVP
jgi:hypothetical protein